MSTSTNFNQRQKNYCIYNLISAQSTKIVGNNIELTFLQISKTNVVDDMVASNSLLYRPGEKPDHTVVIKYVPYVGDSKRAMDEYVSEIMLGGRNTIAIHNTCEDSLLASPLILDLAIIAELCDRIEFRRADEAEYQRFNSALSILSILCKAPLTPHGTPVMNAFFKQRCCIDNIFRACIGLAPLNQMGLEYKAEKISENLLLNRSKVLNSNKTHCNGMGDTHIYNGVNGNVNGVDLNGER